MSPGAQIRLGPNVPGFVVTRSGMGDTRSALTACIEPLTANRRVWTPSPPPGPHAGLAHQTCGVDVYLGILGDFLDETSSG